MAVCPQLILFFVFAAVILPSGSGQGFNHFSDYIDVHITVNISVKQLGMPDDKLADLAAFLSAVAHEFPIAKRPEEEKPMVCVHLNNTKLKPAVEMVLEPKANEAIVDEFILASHDHQANTKWTGRCSSMRFLGSPHNGFVEMKAEHLHAISLQHWLTEVKHRLLTKFIREESRPAVFILLNSFDQPNVRFFDKTVALLATSETNTVERVADSISDLSTDLARDLRSALRSMFSTNCNYTFYDDPQIATTPRRIHRRAVTIGQ